MVANSSIDLVLNSGVCLLLVASRNDVVIDTAAAERFVNQCGAPTKRCAYFDDSGHALLVDHTADRVAHCIAEFLGEPLGQDRVPLSPSDEQLGQTTERRR